MKLTRRQREILELLEDGMRLYTGHGADPYLEQPGHERDWIRWRTFTALSERHLLEDLGRDRQGRRVLRASREGARLALKLVWERYG